MGSAPCPQYETPGRSASTTLGCGILRRATQPDLSFAAPFRGVACGYSAVRGSVDPGIGVRLELFRFG